jgi:TPP-dependent pyruvate/acetoin dehydrogenase alpha subunit
MDVLAVYDAAQRLASRVRSGQPVFLEALCYRFRGHSMADAEFYRTKDEVERWRAYDPILQLKTQLAEEGMIDDARVAELEADVEEMARAAAQFAEESPPPPVESLWRDVYKERDRA